MDARSHVRSSPSSARLGLAVNRLLVARRILALAVAMSAFVAVLAGLTRLGWNVPFASARATEHGPLLVLGVFGTLIGLERAVALGAPWAYGAPAAGAIGAVAGLAGLSDVASWLALVESAFLVAANVAIVRRQSAPFTHLMLLGSVVLVTGTAAWAAGQPVFAVVPTWLAFFVLTIVAERIEMSRLAPRPPWATSVIVAACIAIGAFATASLVWPSAGVRLLGVSFVVVAIWELRFDLARRTVRQRGLPRFAALGVFAGTLWLGASGVGMASFGLPPAGPIYDAHLHTVFIGFVVSMVFAHAPIILPAVARVRVTFGPAFYAPLVLLHAALLARIAGDLLGASELRRAGGLGNAVAIALFVAVALLSRRNAEMATHGAVGAK